MKFPTDQRLKEWLEKEGLKIISGPLNEEGNRLYGVLVPQLCYIITSGDTWQEAVINAIKRDGSSKSLSILGM